MMNVAEIAGYVAAVLVFLTFYMKTMIPLRIVGICSNCAFIAYGYLDGLYPVLILHLVLLPLNTWRLQEMLRLTKQVREAAQSDLKMDWLKPFASSRRISAGDALFRKGDPAGAMYFIVSGRCRLTELGIDILPGQVVGENCPTGQLAIPGDPGGSAPQQVDFAHPRPHRAVVCAAQEHPQVCACALPRLGSQRRRLLSRDHRNEPSSLEHPQRCLSLPSGPILVRMVVTTAAIAHPGDVDTGSPTETGPNT
jgi:CRP-like cAMP-binding protein